MDTVFQWTLPVLLVAMVTWTIWMWPLLENNQRWIAITPILFVAYVISKW